MELGYIKRAGLRLNFMRPDKGGSIKSFNCSKRYFSSFLKSFSLLKGEIPFHA